MSTGIAPEVVAFQLIKNNLIDQGEDMAGKLEIYEESRDVY